MTCMTANQNRLGKPERKRLRPGLEKALPPGNASAQSSTAVPLVGSPRWDRLMELARISSQVREERVRVVAGWVEPRNGRGGWTYVIECASWCGCRRTDR